MILKMFGKVFCGFTRQRFSFLKDLSIAIFGIKLKHFLKRTLSQQSDIIMVYGYLAASGPGQFASTQGTMNSALYQLDTSLKHTTSPLLTNKKNPKNKQIKVLKWSLPD